MSMIDQVMLVGLFVLFALALWLEHKERVRDAAELAEDRDIQRVCRYLREQSRISETVSTCRYLSDSDRANERYASAVLEETAEETAEELAEGAHKRVRVAS